MSEPTTEPMAESFVEHINQRQATNRETAVYVEGDLDTDPPLGNAAAMRVAHLLAGDEEVLRVAPDAADGEEAGDVGAVVITLPPDPPEDQWRAVLGRLMSRVPSGTDIVVLVDTDDVPWFCRQWADVRVVATGIDDPVRAYRVRHHPYSGEVHYREFPEVFAGA